MAVGYPRWGDELLDPYLKALPDKTYRVWDVSRKLVNEHATDGVLDATLLREVWVQASAGAKGRARHVEILCRPRADGHPPLWEDLGDGTYRVTGWDVWGESRERRERRRESGRKRVQSHRQRRLKPDSNGFESLLPESEVSLRGALSVRRNGVTPRPLLLDLGRDRSLPPLTPQDEDLARNGDGHAWDRQGHEEERCEELMTLLDLNAATRRRIRQCGLPLSRVYTALRDTIDANPQKPGGYVWQLLKQESEERNGRNGHGGAS